jgi:hypothetical protein
MLLVVMMMLLVLVLVLVVVQGVDMTQAVKRTGAGEYILSIGG